MTSLFGWAAADDGCRFYRLDQPFEGLRSLGHETHTAIRWEPGPWRDVDVVVGQRITMPGPSSRWLAVNEIFRVYEVDDDLFNLHPSNPGYALFSKTEAQIQIRQNIFHADRVTTSTEYLANRLRRIHKDVRVVPNTIPDYVFDMPRRRNERFTYGWAGSSTHAMDWKESAAEIRRFFETHPEAWLSTIGHNYAEGWGHGHRGWVATVPELYPMLNFHVGLAPLADHRFNYAKSSVKALEYGARGIPVIASDVGPYSDYIEHGVNGFLVRKPGEWAGYMHDLLNDEDGYRSMCINAVTFAEKYRASAWVHEWEKALSPS